ncbi:hypothetical protein HZV92_001827 [Salmonella enterica]|nr:hypothetical protein [Salmonella enterica]EFQ6618166.1 hypothetical protein [Salmonella enterica]
MPYFLDTWLSSQLECLLARYGMEYKSDASLIRFIDGYVENQLDILTVDNNVSVVITQSIPCGESRIALRLSQCVSPESLFGVVGSAFFLDNRLCLATVLPTDLTADEWITIYEHQKELLISFLGK